MAADPENPSGRVARDERGNAIWQWAARDVDPAADVDVATLSLQDEPPSLLGNAKLNTLAAKNGYNPYESGLIEKKLRPKRRDLRELSKWIEAQKRRSQNPGT